MPRKTKTVAKAASGNKSAGQTPMMQQWMEYRAKLDSDTLLLFRLGDFYEMFHEDAREGARILGITLTQRQEYPMAGIPYHAADSYLPRLLAAGKKVAIVDQVETPQAGKLVKRELTRILTAGTTLEENQIDARRNHYLLALDLNAKGMQAAWLDLTTGDFQIAYEADPQVLLAAFNGVDPREVILPERASEKWAEDEKLTKFSESLRWFLDGRPCSKLPDYHFEPSAGAREVMDLLKVLNLEGFGVVKEHPGLGPAGALVYYATETLCDRPRNVRRLQAYTAQRSLLLDPATLRNLEIFKSSQNTRQGSLLEAIDGTVTAAGARLLESWLAAPLLEVAEIQRRQGLVADLVAEPGRTATVREHLRRVRDIARILGRLQNRLRNPRELGGIRDTLETLPQLREELAGFEAEAVRGMTGRIHSFDTLRQELANALSDELPGKFDDGGIIRPGYDAALDRLLSLSRDNRQWLLDLEAQEQARTGIKNLKIKFNNAFGYFIEVTKSNLHLVPEDYTRRQTMTNAERYTTTDLKEKEKEILHAEEKSVAREEELFNALLEKVLDEHDRLAETAAALAELDLLCGWAQLAREWDYTQPEVDDSDVLEIEGGRHPVVEQTLRTERQGLAGTQTFVPNDTALAAGGEQIALITGPNMAGKSTYIRQVALITLMAQIGAWVPAKRARIGIVDRIFSRVGASDELARGNSTFMVEMNETANILNNATPRSLVILDEIGRGTSTYDGLSIAWAVIEHLHNGFATADFPEAGPRTLFATHYHEMTKLEGSLARVRNYSVSVKEWNDEIIFVRQVVPGAADRSYGIQVARLAGLPDSVIHRAKTILGQLENNSPGEASPPEKPTEVREPKKKLRDKEEAGQLSLF